MASFYDEQSICRICRSKDLYRFLDLGSVPPANAFVEAPRMSEPSFPLEVQFCRDCTHVQLRYTVDREFLFSEYPYVSSASDTIPEHFAEQAETVSERFLSEDDLVVDIGSNDGTLLRAFNDVRTIGVEPAENVAAMAEQQGVETLTEFFTPAVARRIRAERGPAAAVCANNVMGHVDDLHALVRGFDELLAPDGVAVIEVPYLVDLLSYVEFDTIYHEHISYFSVRAFRRLFRQFGMDVVDVTRLDVHGGSIRVFVRRREHAGDPAPFVEDLCALEAALGFGSERTYDEFADRVAALRHRLGRFLDSVDDREKRVVGYGAPAKGNVLLNYCGVGPETLDYLVDTTPAKQGTYSPGMNVPVEPTATFRADDPDYALLLAWNYRDTILEKESAFRERGGRFIIPVPYVNVV